MKIRSIGEIAGEIPSNNLGVRWNEIVGKVLVEKCSPKTLKDGVLTIFVTSSSWSHHINALKHDIIRNIDSKMGVRVKKIKFISSSRSSAPVRRIGFYNESEILTIGDKVEINKDVFTGVSDNQLRIRLEKLAALSLTRAKNFI